MQLSLRAAIQKKQEEQLPHRNTTTFHGSAIGNGNIAAWTCKILSWGPIEMGYLPIKAIMRPPCHPNLEGRMFMGCNKVTPSTHEGASLGMRVLPFRI